MRNTNNFLNIFSPALQQAEKMLREIEKDGFNFHNWPPLNIERHGEDQFKIILALAGWKLEEIDITVQENLLTIKGNRQEKEEDEKVSYLYKGIAQRSFTQKIPLTNFIKVKGASLKDGILTISLVREVPEEKKPQKVNINSDDTKSETVETNDETKEE